MASIQASRQPPLVVVLVHCAEPLHGVVRQLRQAHLPFVVYHKTSPRCRTVRREDVEPGELVSMPNNLGRECSGYLRFIVDRYETSQLPRMTAFLQAGAEMHLPFTRGLMHTLQPLLNATAAGYVGLSKNSFEGRWPSPCEPPRHVAAFAACADSYWREAAGAPGDAGPEAGRPPPDRFRFYANGLFAASAERIRRRPLAYYQQLLDRLEGRAPLRCVNPRDVRQGAFAPWVNDTQHLAPAEIDCLMLEKLWHVVMGERALMPRPSDYDAGGGRFTAAYVQTVERQGGRRRAGTIECPERSNPGS